MTSDLEFGPPTHAILRTVSNRFADCEREHEIEQPIDVVRAREQHRYYAATLREFGIHVTVLPAAHAYPDACFVEDPAVVLQHHAIIGRSGVASREGEHQGIEEALSAHREILRMEAPARLEGGDVMRAGRLLFVGRTARTDEAGIEAITELADREDMHVVGVDVMAGLHLKSAMSLLDPTTILVDDGVDIGPLRQAGLECIHVPERMGANVLALGRKVIVSAAAPRTAKLVASRGFEVRRLDVGEFHKGDGALTCLSLRLAKPGTWCV